MRKLVIAVFASLFLLLAFQNCGDKINLNTVKSEEPRLAQSGMQAQGCVNSVKMSPEKTKFLFVIDLSLSNFGDFFQSNYVFNGSTYGGYWFFQQGVGTDPTGIRFDSISDFVNTCGNSGNQDYAIIGFSGSAGEIVKQNGYNKLECKKRFMNASAVQAQLGVMKAVQTEELNYYSQFQPPSKPLLSDNDAEIEPLIFKETNYVSAADCITSTIEADIINSGAETSNYQVFFLSDGEANAESTGCEDSGVADKVACYTNKMDLKLSYLMKLSAAKSKPVRIHSMYYTRNGAQNLSIESYMNYISSVGQTNSPINLGSFQNGNQGENPFCKLLAVDKSVVYRTNKIYAVNTNTLKIGSNLKHDADQDGIPDEDEAKFNASEGDPRSMADGVLDGVCKMLGGRDICRQKRAAITCDPKKINAFRMSDCDIKILKLDKLSYRPELVGIDSDNDGIPDYIEIIKGLSPINSDSYLDFDNDGLTNLQEVALGLDPFTPDTADQPLVISDSVFREQINTCTSGGWELNIKQLSGIPGENNLMLFFRTESKNTQGLFEYREYDMGYELTKTKSGLGLRLDRDYVGVSDFKLVTGIAP